MDRNEKARSFRCQQQPEAFLPESDAARRQDQNLLFVLKPILRLKFPTRRASLLLLFTRLLLLLHRLCFAFPHRSWIRDAAAECKNKLRLRQVRSLAPGDFGN